MNGNIVRLLLIGPTAVVLLTAFLAAAALLAGAAGRLGRLTRLGWRATDRLSHGRALLPLWGLAALLLLLLASAVLFHIKPLALLGLLVLLLGLTLAGFGLGVGAARCGRSLAAALGQPFAPPLLTLVLGLTTFLLAAFLPFLGWLVVLLALLTGIGATLDVLVRRK